MTHRSLLRALACAVALATGSILTGCSGVVKNLNAAQVNTPPVTIDNAFNLNNVTATVKLGNTATTQTFAFTNSSPQSISASQVVSASLNLGINPTVTVTVPAGQTLPATFTLTALSFTPTVSGANGSNSATLGQLTAAGTPITLTQTSATGLTGTYTASSPVLLQTSTSITGTNLTNLVTLLNTSGNDQAVLTLNAGSTTLPTNSTITFTITTNQLVVSFSS